MLFSSMVGMWSMFLSLKPMLFSVLFGHVLPCRLSGIWCSQGFEEAGTDMAQLLTAKDVMAKKKAAMSAGVAKALARLSSGLYVVTAANNSARGAMIASWVAQASFEPLGLTIAVAKDRAIESLMQVLLSRPWRTAASCTSSLISSSLLAEITIKGIAGHDPKMHAALASHRLCEGHSHSALYLLRHAPLQLCCLCGRA